MKKPILSALIIVASLCCYGQDQLVLEMPVNNNVENASSSNYTIQQIGSISYVSGQDGADKGALYFPSINSYLKSNDFNGLGNKAFTLAFWYKNRASSDNKGLLIKTGRKKDERQLFSIDQRKHQHSDSISLFFYVYEKDIRTTSLDPWRPLWFKVNLDKNWHHIAMTGKASDKVVIYIDGNEMVSKSVTQSSFSFPPETLLIGHYDDSYDNRMGVFDDIRIYNNVISRDLLNRIYARVDGEGAELEGSAMGSLAELPMEDPSDKVNGAEVIFNKESREFSSIIEGESYTYTFPNNLQYKSHKFSEQKVVVKYSKPSTKENYIGVWNRQMQYQGEYNFKNLKIKKYKLQSDGQEGLLMIHYDDLANNSSFVGVFSNKAAYLGQYDVTNATKVRMAFRNNKLQLRYTYQDTNYQVQIDKTGKEISKQVVNKESRAGKEN